MPDRREETSTMEMERYNDDNVFYRNWKKFYPTIDRGEGIHLFDSDGKRYIDAVGGVCVVNVGHGVREIVDAMMEQAKKVCFAHVSQFTSQAQVTLARKVVELAPKGMTKVYFVSGGSVATEMALKMARQYHLCKGNETRYRFISFWRGYSGSTIAALSMSGITHRRKDYQPYLLDFPHIEPPYCYRCAFDREYPGCDLYCANQLETVIKQEGKNSIAAFIAEPILGGGGVIVPPSGYYEIIREICDKYDVLWIADEVITGFGRTGKNFGVDHWSVCPDLMAFGKGISGGYSPLGGTIVHEKIFDTFVESDKSGFFMGQTYSGNPLSCATGVSVLEYLEDNDLIQQAERIGQYLFQKMSTLKKLPIVGDVRGKGLMLGIEFVQNKEKKTPFDREKKISENFVNWAFDKGLILYPEHGVADGLLGDSIIIAPPFILSELDADEIVHVLEETIVKVQEQL